MALGKMSERLGPARRADKVGHDENEGAPLHDAKSGLQKVAQVRRRRAGRLGPGKYSMQDVEGVTPAASSRNDGVHRVAVKQRADAIAVAREKPGQHGDELGRDRTLFDLRAELHRRTQVEQEPRRHFPVFVIDSDVGSLQTRGYVPIDVTNVVVVLVLDRKSTRLNSSH